MRFPVFLLTMVFLSGLNGCKYIKDYKAEKCSCALAGKIAEYGGPLTSFHEQDHVLTDLEKKRLLSEIPLPDCVSNFDAAATEYQIAIVLNGEYSFRVDVWPTASKRNRSN